MIDGSSTDFSTVCTDMKHAQKISSSIGQSDSVITFDLAIYTKAKQVQWRCPEELSDTVIRMGGFHIALNFLSLIGKKYTNSGLDDLLIESGVYAAGTTLALIKGKCYNRGIRGHKLAMEAFQQWISDQHPESEHIMREQLHGKISECRVAAQNKSVGQENVEELALNVQEVVDLL